MNNSALINRIFILALFTGLASCGSETKSTEDASDEFAAAEEELKEKISSVIHELPPPSEVPFLLEATGADFNESLVNPIERADSYKSTSQKSALNLGIYATDIGYLSSYNKTQEALNYLNASKGIADNMGITGAFDVELLKRFESNLNSRDSLASIINESVGKADEYLRNDDRTKVAVMVLSGSFVEGLSIATKLVETYPKDLLPEEAKNLILTPIIRVILNQEKPLTDLIDMLEDLPADSELAGLIASFRELKTIYEESDIEEKISQNQADLILSGEYLTAISDKISEIRNSIVN
ncbi:MAG TPA: hypothetical protein VGA21_08245 [Cyclobacteriaceae bacterium]|jgi:hypothetical protein